MPFLRISWDLAPNSCHMSLTHKPFISVPGTPAEPPTCSQLVCLLCWGHCYRDPCIMAFSSSFQYGGYYSFFSKQDFKQFAASWISKPRKRQMSSFFSPLFGLLLCWLHQELEGLLSKFRWGCMGTRHLNVLFFLSEGENPFSSQPFLKRNFDLLNPEARVSFPLRQVWALEPILWCGYCRPPNQQLSCPSSL